MSFVPSVVIHDLTFAWPDGTPALAGLNGAFGPGRTGLVGRNGAGKSTLLRLIASELAPTAGSISIAGTAAYLPQRLTTDPGATIADLLGVATVLDAIRRLEAGDAAPEVFDAIGDDWGAEARATAALEQAGLPIDDLDRRADTLSGGETMLVGLVGVSLRRASVALLDEPTNNLDVESRERVHELIRSWRGPLLVVSHDRHLLDLMDATAELREGSLRVFGGTFSQYREQLEVEQAAALRQLRSAEQQLKTERRQRVEAEQRIAHSERQARKDQQNRRYVKAVVNDRRNSAEKAQGSRRGMLDDKVESATSSVEAAEQRVRDDRSLSIVLPDPDVPTSRRLATLRDASGREHVIQGPERVALIGRNGVGKTTLLRRLIDDTVPAVDGPVPAAAGRPSADAATDRIGHLSQQLESLNDDESVLQNLERFATGRPTAELRNELARLHLRGDTVERRVGSLSGGERFRVALAQLLHADPPAQLLVLDEPTNNLDLESTDQLIDTLNAYRGALIVVSHDREFLGRLALTTVLRLHPGGELESVGVESLGNRPAEAGSIG